MKNDDLGLKVDLGGRSLFDEMERDIRRAMRPAWYIVALIIVGKLLKWSIILGILSGIVYVGHHFIVKYW